MAACCCRRLLRPRPLLPGAARRRCAGASTPVVERLKARIVAAGPLTVAQYMQEVLTHPVTGYYSTRDVFGVDGDFTTSPEICQIFGELLAVWCVDQWNRMGRPLPLHLVELGPGRGTLAADMLRVFSKLALPSAYFRLHLVEVSPALQKLQMLKLCGITGEVSENVATLWGFPVTWHSDLAEVPRGFSIYVAHEFFDALPIHSFKKTTDGWREVLVDVDETGGGLRFVLSRHQTPASLIFLKEDPALDCLEVSPQSAVLVQQLADRVVEDGGVVLVADYGRDGPGGDTFRSFKHHRPHDPLLEPGTADLTADVDFKYIKECINQKQVVIYGPVPQRKFLTNLGLEVRLQKLLKNCEPDVAQQLKSGCEMLTSPDKMGERFLFLGIYPACLKPYLDAVPPSGFS